MQKGIALSSGKDRIRERNKEIRRKYILRSLKDFSYDIVKPLKRGMNEKALLHSSTQTWAIDEIRNRIKTIDRDPIDIVERFVRQMALFESYGGPMSEHWKTAKEVGENALDFLNAL